MLLVAQEFIGSPLERLLIIAIIIAAVIAVFWIILKVVGIGIPDWAIKIFWIIVAAVVGIFAIKFLFSLL